MFSSKAQKQEKDYQYLRQILKESDIDTVEKVKAHQSRIIKKGLYATAILLVVLAVFCLASPKYVPIWGIVGIMCFAWIWRSAFVAKNIMHRYIEEEVNQGEKMD